LLPNPKENETHLKAFLGPFGAFYIYSRAICQQNFGGFGLWPLGFGLWALGLWKGRQAPSTKHQAPHKTLHKTLQTKKFLPLRGQQEHKLGTLKALLSCQLFFVNVL